jgi:hypothetical protein
VGEIVLATKTREKKVPRNLLNGTMKINAYGGQRVG